MLNPTEIAKKMFDTDNQISEMLSISTESIAEMKFDLGIQYLEITLQDMAESQRRLSRQEFFWGWWSLQFYRRSLQWINYTHRNILNRDQESFRQYHFNQLRSTPITEQLYQIAISKSKEKWTI